MSHNQRDEKTLKTLCNHWMLGNASEYVDQTTGEVNCTRLAEDCAYAYDHPQWLDNPDHWIWELSVTFA